MKLKRILFDIYLFFALPVIVVGIALLMMFGGIDDDDLEGDY